jgi:polysaccharide biosynthesis protein PslA
MRLLRDGELNSLVAAKRPVLPAAAFWLVAAGADFASVVMSSLAAGVAWHAAVYGMPGYPADFARLGAASAWLFVVLNAWGEEYRFERYRALAVHGPRRLRRWVIACALTLAFAFLTKNSDAYSRGWLLLFFVSGFAWVSLMRLGPVLLLAAARSAGLVAARRVLLVGAEPDLLDFMQRYELSGHGLQVIGLPLGAEGESAAETDDALRRALARARSLAPDDIVIVAPWSDRDAIERAIDAFMTMPVDLHLGPERILDRFGDVQITQVGPIASLRLSRRPLSAAEALLKRGFDLALASAALLCLAPFLAVVAVAIKLDSLGPVFFLQRRYGFNQEPFRIVKFRTMTSADDGAVVVQAKAVDPRVTRVGRWLRRWNIDELPQLLNVLRGEMSLVGPRPHALAHDQAWARKISLYARRHNVKPGITGWAQVNGLRGEIGTDEALRRRVEHDLYYIDNWSIWLDIQILLRTVCTRKAFLNAW